MSRHKLEEMIDNLIERDKNMLNDMHGMFGSGSTIENRIVIADSRAMDALMAVSILARHVVELEQKIAAMKGE